MASPVDTFKNNLFGQLKSCSNAVQGAFEQRIARPLIALKRDLARSSSKHRESTSPSSSPLEIIDFENNSPVKTVIDTMQNSALSSLDQRISEDFTNIDAPTTIRDNHQSSIISSVNKDVKKNRLCYHKSVSFADHIITTSIDDAANQISSTDKYTIVEENADDFEQHVREMIKPRRISIGNSKDLVYQDLSAEIVAYVLKHALRILENEDKDLLLKENNHQQNEDIMNLK